MKNILTIFSTTPFTFIFIDSIEPPG